MTRSGFALAGAGSTGADPAAQAPVAPSTTEAPPPATEAPPAEDSVNPALSGTGAPPLNEQTVYTAKYEKQELTLKAECRYSMYADVDEPRANVGNNGYDLALTGFCPNRPSYLSLGGGVEGSTSGSPNMTPQDCAEKIRTAPLGDATVPARKGTVVCLTTSFAEAQERGDDQRLVLLEVTGVAETAR